VDHVITVTAALDDDLLGSLLGLLRLGNGKWNLAFFLLRALFRDGSRFLGCRGRLCIDQRGLNFLGASASRRTSSKKQGCQDEQSQRSRVSGRCVHAADSTHRRARCMRTGTKKSNVFAAVTTRAEQLDALQ